MPNFETIHELGSAPIKAWIKGVELEEEAKQQLLNVAKLPFIHSHVAAMPDVHWGIGATVGSVIATHRAIIPAAVGVDIGCGMLAARLNLKASDLPTNLKSIRTAIETAVPHGRTNNGQSGDRGAWGNAPDNHQKVWQLKLATEFEQITTKHSKIGTKLHNSLGHLGTLGSGNHFIELCLDENQDVWIMLHSGSRGIGNKIGSYFIELAKEDMRQWFINLPDTNLSYFPQGTQHFNEYCEAVAWAQLFAQTNRELMLKAILIALTNFFEIRCTDEAVNCHHNYVQMENHFNENVWVTRKGAVSARLGQLGIIPGSMGAKSYIVKGKGNPDSFNSCSHGAGRRMSRTKAKQQFTLEDHMKATKGVECRKDADVIDETPGAYKDIDAVLAAQSDLVEVVHTLKQVLCVKG